MQSLLSSSNKDETKGFFGDPFEPMQYEWKQNTLHEGEFRYNVFLQSIVYSGQNKYCCINLGDLVNVFKLKIRLKKPVP